VLSDAAIEVIAASGMRGLTHRAVDSAADVPAGSTSYYFRSRRALLEAVLIRLNALNTTDTAPVVAAFARRDGAHENDPVTAPELDDLACTLAGIFDRWLAAGRHRLLARYACEAEVAQDPELRNLLTSAAALDEQAAQIAVRAGAPDAEARGRNMVACLRGLIYSRVASTGVASAPAPGTPEGQEELYIAVRRVVRAFIPCHDEPYCRPAPPPAEAPGSPQPRRPTGTAPGRHPPCSR
jgi:DNA-binding transcriptional regulator YbjK